MLLRPMASASELGWLVIILGHAFGGFGGTSRLELGSTFVLPVRADGCWSCMARSVAYPSRAGIHRGTHWSKPFIRPELVVQQRP